MPLEKGELIYDVRESDVLGQVKVFSEDSLLLTVRSLNPNRVCEESFRALEEKQGQTLCPDDYVLWWKDNRMGFMLSFLRPGDELSWKRKEIRK